MILSENTKNSPSSFFCCCYCFSKYVQPGPMTNISIFQNVTFHHKDTKQNWGPWGIHSSSVQILFWIQRKISFHFRMLLCKCRIDSKITFFEATGHRGVTTLNPVNMGLSLPFVRKETALSSWAGWAGAKGLRVWGRESSWKGERVC